jgi:hypothetical protein
LHISDGSLRDWIEFVDTRDRIPANPRPLPSPPLLAPWPWV